MRSSPPSTSTTRVVPDGAHLVQAILAGHYQRRAAPSRASAPAIVVEEAGSETPMSWRVAPAGLVSGPRKLKIVRTASSLRTGTTKRVAPWWAGANMKPKPTSLDAARDGLGREVDPHAERLEHVGRARQPGRRAVAVLGDRAAGAGGDQRRGRRDVERRPPAAGARGVEQVVAAGRRPASASARIVARQAGELVDRLALRAQRDQQGGDLRLGRVAGHDLGEHRGGLLGASRSLARGERVDRLGQDGVRPRKFASSALAVGRQHRLGVELHALGGQLAVADAHDHAAAAAR